MRNNKLILLRYNFAFIILVLIFQNCGLGSFDSRFIASESSFASLTDLPGSPDRTPDVLSGAVYYVAPDGADSNPGSSDRPWKTIQKCATAPVRAGDTCIVRDGTYTSSTSGRVVTIGPSSPAGEAGKPITIRAANIGGAKIVVPNTWPGSDCSDGVTNCPFTGFYINRPYYTIQGFSFSRPGTFYSTTSSVTGIVLNKGADNTSVRFNYFSKIGINICNNGLMGIAGIYLEYVNNVVIENNRFNAIGRLRNGENGCSTDKYQHDHGIYANGTTDLTIQRNVIFDVNRGSPINIKAYEGKTLRAKIYNNTISGKSPTGLPKAHIALTNKLDDIQIKNNIFNDPPDGYILWWYITSEIVGTVGIVMTDNLSNTTRSQFDMTNPYLRPPSGIKSENNMINTDPMFANAPNADFHLTSNSPAIDRGTDVGLTVRDGKPDIGAYEKE